MVTIRSDGRVVNGDSVMPWKVVNGDSLTTWVVNYDRLMPWRVVNGDLLMTRGMVTTRRLGRVVNGDLLLTQGTVTARWLGRVVNGDLLMTWGMVTARWTQWWQGVALLIQNAVHWIGSMFSNQYSTRRYDYELLILKSCCFFALFCNFVPPKPVCNKMKMVTTQPIPKDQFHGSVHQ